MVFFAALAQCPPPCCEHSPTFQMTSLGTPESRSRRSTSEFRVYGLGPRLEEWPLLPHRALDNPCGNQCITEINELQFVLIGMWNRTFGPYFAAVHRTTS
jgi:hypothetical protein